MMHLTTAERYEYFLDTLNKCGLFLLRCSEEDIAYLLFEEFDGDCTSFLSAHNLCALLEEERIGERVYHMVLTLSYLFRKLERTPLWTPHAVKTAPEWHAVMYLCDCIKEEVHHGME